MFKYVGGKKDQSVERILISLMYSQQLLQVRGKIW